MKREKTIDEKPICIQDIDSWYILYHILSGRPLMLNDFKKKKDYNKGRIPMSLDSLKMWEICKELTKNGSPKDIFPTAVGHNALKCSNALINVRFSRNPSSFTAFRLFEMLKEKPTEDCDDRIETSIGKDVFYLPSVKEADSKKTDNDVRIAFIAFTVSMMMNGILYDIADTGKTIVKSKDTDEYKEKLEKLGELLYRLGLCYPKKNEKWRNDLKIYISEMRELLSDNEEKDTESIKKLVDDSAKNRNKTLNLACDYLRNAVKQWMISKYPQMNTPRELLYNFGFEQKKANEDKARKYCLYKRSASKAKSGSCLFIIEELYRPMMDWTWMGLKFLSNKQDLTSLKAYEALVQSSIERTVPIKAKNILMIDSVETGHVPGNRYIMIKDTEQKLRLVNEKEYEEIKGEKYHSSNNIWDGQALADESLFIEAGYGKEDPHGMMLLRNHFFKACAFRTRISKYYEDNGVKEVTDMFGNKMNAADIKLIVTPDSLKILKFTGKLKVSGKKVIEQENEMYGYWKKHLADAFGIVKTEHASYLGDYHELSYQILNTFPLNKDDMKEIVKDELEYLKKLYYDPAVFLQYIKGACRSFRKAHYFYTMFHYFKAFANTESFKRFKAKEIIYKYKEKLSIGKIKVKSDMYVLCSMPYEMLKYSADGKKDDIKPVLGSDQVYVQGMEDGKDVVLCRYPHISSGAICVMNNSNCAKTRETLEKYFDLSNKNDCNIVVVSPWENNIMVKLGGADFDSDSVLMIKDTRMIQAAKRLRKLLPLEPGGDGLPVAEADPSLKGSAKEGKLSRSNLAELDEKLTGNVIGKLSNLAQYFNAYLLEGCLDYLEMKDSEEKEIKGRYLKEVYQCVLKLSVLNELEIDSAKHKIDIDMNDEMSDIRNTSFDGKSILIRNENGNIYAPNFMLLAQRKKTGKGKVYGSAAREYKYWNCPVDHIARILDEGGFRDSKSTCCRDIDFWNNMIPAIDRKEIDYKKIRKVKNMILRAADQLDELGADILEETAKTLRDEMQSDCLEELRYQKLSDKTLIFLFILAVDRYKDNGKNGEYKKGDPKYPDVSGNLTYMGSLIAFSEERRYYIAENGKKTDQGVGSDPLMNALIRCAKEKYLDDEKTIPYIDGNRSNPVLTTDIKEADQPIKYVNIWGKTYYYKTEDLRNI